MNHDGNVAWFMFGHERRLSDDIGVIVVRGVVISCSIGSCSIPLLFLVCL